MKMKNLFPAALGVLSLLGVSATAIAAEEKAPVTGETAQAEIDEIITSTVRVHAVNLGKRQLTVQNQ